MNVNKAEMRRRQAQSQKDKMMALVPRRNKVKSMGTNLNIGTRRAPASEFREYRNRFATSVSNRSGAIVIDGQDYLGQFSTTGNQPVGTNLFNYIISPSSNVFAGSRLYNFANLYEKYVFRKLRFHVQTGSPTSSVGSYVLAFDRDVGDGVPPSTEAGIRQYLANQFARTAAVWEDCTIEVPLVDTQDFYYTNYVGSDPRLAYQGRLIVGVQTPLAGSISLSVWVEYIVEFMDPALENLDLQTTGTYNPSQVQTLQQGLTNYTNTVYLRGDSLQLATNNAQLLGSYATQNQLTGGGQGFLLPSGQYKISMATSVKNNNSSPTSFQAYLPGQANVATQSGSTNPLSIITSNVGTAMNAVFGYGFSTSAFGDAGYTTSVTPGSYDNNIYEWIANVPAGGAVISPTVICALTGMVFDGIVLFISKITAKAAATQ